LENQSGGNKSSSESSAGTLYQSLVTFETKFQGEWGRVDAHRSMSPGTFNSFELNPLNAIVALFDGSVNETNLGVTSTPRLLGGVTLLVKSNSLTKT
jgi:hypothetical protein